MELTGDLDLGSTPGFLRSNIERSDTLSPDFLRLHLSIHTVISSLLPSSSQAAIVLPENSRETVRALIRII